MIKIWMLLLFNLCLTTTNSEKYAEVESILISRSKRDIDINELLGRMRRRLQDPVDEEHDELETENEDTHAYTWTVQLHSKDFNDATKLASDYGFDHISDVRGIADGVYRFSHDPEKFKKKQSYKSEDSDVEKTVEKREFVDTSKKFLEDKRVRWYKRERYIEREKRAPLQEKSQNEVIEEFNDPYFGEQWYIRNDGQTDGPKQFDDNIMGVWKLGYTGKGQVLSVLDDGMDHTHPDLKKNYDPVASKDLNGNDDDPFPNDSDPYNAHGTKCAGTIAAEANNNICGVGIAHDAKVGAIRMLDGRATDGLEADALSFHRDHIDIYSCSWGPKDNGQTFGRPGELGRVALAQGAKFGRNGLGSLFIWATGNGGMMSDDCNADGYVNSIYTLGIGSVNEFGVSTYYGERCPSIMAVTYCSGKHKSTSFTNKNANVITTYLHHQCTNHFVGTSSAAPLAAAIFALVLEANSKLTWRDVQHLVYETAEKTSPLDSGWMKNGCEKPYNHKFGFGVLNAKKLIDKALKWKNVEPQRNCHFRLKFANGDIPSGHHFKLSFTTDGCQTCKGKMCQHSITKLEHVVVNVTLKHRRRGDLSIDLISPAGTVSHLLHRRPYDSSPAGLKGWTFMSLFNWCENPKGTWQLLFRDKEGNSLDIREGRDMEEEYVHMLNKRKQQSNDEKDDTTANVREEKQVYENPVKKSFNQYAHSKRSEDEYNNYERRQMYDDESYYSKKRKRRSEEKDEERDQTDYVKYKKSLMNNVNDYKDDVLKDSILAGEVLGLSVTFYGT